MGLLRRLRRNLAARGLAGTLHHLYQRAFPRTVPVHPFDLEHGVDTSGLLYAERLTTGHPHDRHNTAYWGTAPSLLHGAMAEWERTLAGTAYTVRDYTLLDIGSGKGRVVMLASLYPFRAVVGVELNPELSEVARQNLARWQQTPRACGELSVKTADALELELPETPVLLYLFNPFHAPVLELLLSRLEAAARTRSTPIDLIYTRPEHAAVFATVPNMHLLWAGDLPFNAEDCRADAFGTTRQTAHLYRLMPARGASAG